MVGRAVPLPKNNLVETSPGLYTEIVNERKRTGHIDTRGHRQTRNMDIGRQKTWVPVGRKHGHR